MHAQKGYVLVKEIRQRRYVRPTQPVRNKVLPTDSDQSWRSVLAGRARSWDLLDQALRITSE